MYKLRPDYLKAIWTDFIRISKLRVTACKKWLRKHHIKVLIYTVLFFVGVIAHLLSSPRIIIADSAPFEPVEAVESKIEPIAVKEATKAKKIVREPVQKPTQDGDCHSWIEQAGVKDSANAYELIMRESGCNPRAVNPSSGACGIPQNINGCTTYDPVEQIKWMENYCVERYGSWAAANQFQLANGWY